MTRSTDFQTRSADFAAVLDRTHGQWDAPTPCEEWTVRDVVAHTIETERDFLQQRGFDLPSSPSLEDPASAWREHAAAVVAVLERPGVAEQGYHGYFGPTTIGATMADFYGWDLAIHGWDIGVATGQEPTIPEEEAERLSATADGWGPSLYAEGVCRPAVPVDDDASAQDKLLGRLGRDPRWQPPAS